MSNDLTTCSKCGKKNTITFQHEGKLLCVMCYEEMQYDYDEKEFKEQPKMIHFASKTAKMGKYRRIIEIPKTQKPLVVDGVVYDIIMLPLGNKRIEAK